MSGDAVLQVVRRYHEGWTKGRYEQAIDLLAPTLEVEVPINDYPDAESFAQALRGFGPLVTSVDLLSEMSDGDEAMLLYDLEVERLGQLRVVEHFTVAAGKITRLRQIHDTAAVRAAGLGQPAETASER
jgi:ketosteroid isomerase-like protein